MHFRLKRIHILLILGFFLGVSFGILSFIELKSYSAGASFSLIRKSDLKNLKHLTIQGNSFLPVSNINFDEATWRKINENKGETIIATITGYIPIKEQTDDTPCIVASGLNACKETDKNIIACPRRYPFGTKILIAGKIYVCEDRTNVKYDGIFDIFLRARKR